MRRGRVLSGGGAVIMVGMLDWTGWDARRVAGGRRVAEPAEKSREAGTTLGWVPSPLRGVMAKSMRLGADAPHRLLGEDRHGVAVL